MVWICRHCVSQSNLSYVDHVIRSVKYLLKPVDEYTTVLRASHHYHLQSIMLLMVDKRTAKQFQYVQLSGGILFQNVTQLPVMH